MTEPTILIAFSAGLASFVAPCILAMIPAFLAYISGTTLTEIKNKQKSIHIGNYGTFCGALMARMMYKLKLITLA